MIEKAIRAFLFFVILSVPIQLGKHFWPNFSFVSGIRVDYLSPTLYISDILIILLLAISLFKERIFAINLKDKALQLSFFLFILVLLLGMFTSKSQNGHAYGILKLLEFSLLGISIAKYLKISDFKFVVYIISFGSFIESFVAIFQLFLQHSVGGALYFLGERTFFISTIGVAKMNIFNTQILRPYGTFSHPNVLAFFLLFSIVLSMHYVSFEKKHYVKTFLWISSVVSSITLFFTFSRVAILCFIGLIVYKFVSGFIKEQNKRSILIVVLSLSLVFIGFYNQRFFAFGNDFFYRIDLLLIGFNIFQKNLLFGVGLNNFFIHEVEFQKNISPIFLQPIHNIYLLTLVSLGILGSIFPIIFFRKTGKYAFEMFAKAKSKLEKSMRESFIVLLLITFIAGFFDHFLLTVQQGQLMLVLILGFAWIGKEN